MKISAFLSSNRRYLAFLYDLMVSVISFALALYLRLGDQLLLMPLETLLAGMAIFVSVCALVFPFSGLYRGVWAFSSLRDLAQIMRATFLSVLLFVLAAFLTTRLEGVPRTVPFITGFIMLVALGGARMSVRLLRERRLSNIWKRWRGGRAPILLAGAEDDIEIAVRALTSNPLAPFEIVGILESSARRFGNYIHGIAIVGSVNDINGALSALRKRGITPVRLVLTRGLTRMNGALVGSLLETCNSLGLGLSRLPSLTALQHEGVHQTTDLSDQPLVLEDLLGRPEVVPDHESVRSLLSGKCILITGAGGSIGSELARQVVQFTPRKLILIDISEFNLWRLEQEMQQLDVAHVEISLVLGDVRDSARIEAIFVKEKPDIVFHAAAVKHVPLAESNPAEAFLTNAYGTRVVAEASAHYSVKAMVLISTDKAVAPTSVMGATKRMAETIMLSRGAESDVDGSDNRCSTRFVAVRFGNVLGSTGSVVPIFRDQIARGGPVTVTHPDMTRWFMTIREAVELVLQAAFLGSAPESDSRALFVLDMGRPMKILDLAYQMIRLSGLRPQEDVEIKFTGIRAGEKMHEELVDNGEKIMPVSPGLNRVVIEREVPLWKNLIASIDELKQSMLSDPHNADNIARQSIANQL